MKNAIKFYRIVLKILASVAVIFYVVFLVDEEISLVKAISLEAITVYLLFIFFLFGYIYVWRNEMIAGILWVIWYILQWVLVLNVWTDGGMTLVLGFPIPIIGLFLLWHGWRQRSTKKDINAH